ncbi:MAG: hypothetical protein ACRDL3_04670 [Solirubrobacterales bacterium]
MAIVALCVAGAISGCGDDGGGSDAVPAELVDHFPGGQIYLMFADFAAMKQQLGLPEDADIARFPPREDSANTGQQQLAATAARILSYYLELPKGKALRAAIDHGAIVAGASNGVVGRPGLAVIRTDQSFDDIAEGLPAKGYERDGDLLESKSSAQGVYGVLADGGDGVIVLGFRRRTVEDALSGTAGSDDPVRALLEDVEGVARGSVKIVGNCVRALAVGESFDPDTTELRVGIDGEASADRFRLPELRERPHLEYGEPEVDGGTLIVEITGGRDPDIQGVVIARDLSVLALDPDRIYEC